MLSATSLAKRTGAAIYIRRRAGRNKIDAAVALIMAVGRAMVEDEQAKGLDGFLANPFFG